MISTILDAFRKDKITHAVIMDDGEGHIEIMAYWRRKGVQRYVGGGTVWRNIDQAFGRDPTEEESALSAVYFHYQYTGSKKYNANGH